MLYCLDTNIVIDFFRNDEKIRKKMQERELQNIQLSVTPIVLCELWQGAYLAPKQKNPTDLIVTFLHSADIINFTEEACRIFGEQYALLQKGGRQTQESDLMIAAICIAHDAILITRNENDFKNIKGLKYHVW
jgi:predicted nucleic acid-binding protein